MKTSFSFKLHVPWAFAWVIAVFGLGSCQNELSWGNDVHVPVFDDRLSWDDIVPDSLFRLASTTRDWS